MMLGLRGDGNADQIGVWGVVARRLAAAAVVCALGGAVAQQQQPVDPSPDQTSASADPELQPGEPEAQTGGAAGDASGEEAVDPDGAEFVVGELTLRYFREHPRQPTLEELGELEVTLGVIDGVYVSAREGIPSETLRISDLGDGTVRRMRASALTEVMRAVVEAFKRRTIIGVFVAPDPTQVILRDGGIDYRDGETGLTLVIYTARVTRVRSIASGQRVPRDERINNPLHARILERSPVRAHREGEDESERRDLLIKEELDDYALRLNRRPGRRVDIAVAPAEGIGNAELQCA